jgi:hypothetical protein
MLLICKNTKIFLFFSIDGGWRVVGGGVVVLVLADVVVVVIVIVVVVPAAVVVVVDIIHLVAVNVVIIFVYCLYMKLILRLRYRSALSTRLWNE